MKKLLAMCLVLAIASVANAAVIEIVRVDIGSSGGRLGLSDGDKLDVGDVIGIDLIVAHNPYPSFTSYDGYLVSNIDFSLTANGAATISATSFMKDLITPIVTSDLDTIVWETAPIDGSGNIVRIQGLSLGGVNGDSASNLILSGLTWVASNDGLQILDLGLVGQSQYAEFTTPPDGGGGEFGGWINMVEADLGDIMIYQVPEPITMSLLGLGGLALIRRRRKA